MVILLFSYQDLMNKGEDRGKKLEDAINRYTLLRDAHELESWINDKVPEYFCVRACVCVRGCYVYVRVLGNVILGLVCVSAWTRVRIILCTVVRVLFTGHCCASVGGSRHF